VIRHRPVKARVKLGARLVMSPRSASAVDQIACGCRKGQRPIADEVNKLGRFDAEIHMRTSVSALAELMVRIHSPPAGSLRTIARDGRGRRRKCRSEIKTTEFDGNLWPPEPSLEGFREFITQEARYLETFWHQFGNSFFIGLLTMVLTGAMTSRCQLIAHGSGRCAIIASYGEIIESGAHLRHFAVRPDWARRGIPRSKRRDEANQRTGEWRE